MQAISKICKYLFFILIVVCLFAAQGANQPALAAGASLYLAPSAGTYVINNAFTISVKVNSGGEAINAVEGLISYDKDLLDATAVSSGGSIISLWISDPAISKTAGTISFSGGSPKPYTGTAGQIISITFKSKKAGKAFVRFSSGAVTAHDGKGTNILASMGSANYTISPKVEAEKEDAGVNKPSLADSAEKTETKPEADYNKPLIKSLSHPDSNSWYNNNTAKFAWEMPESIIAVSIDFNQEPTSDPGPNSDGVFKEKDYPDIKDGVWYLHLKFKDNKKWGTVAHYKVMIDTEAPKPFAVEVVPALAGEWPLLRFAASDDKSGLDRYEIILGDLNGKPVVLEADKQEYKIAGLSVGEHSALVKAVDKAGNERIATANFKVEAIAAPLIKNYAQEIRPDDNFYINGTATGDCEITIIIQKPDGKEITGQAQSDASGNWFYVSAEKFENGRYIVWVIARNNNGIESLPSEKVSFLATPPIFATIGAYVINYFTVFASLLFIIVLIIALVIYILGFVRRRLRKETVEIEKVLHENLQAYEADFEKESLRMSKFEGKASYKAEKEKSQAVLKAKIEEIEKKILKEIRDVEKIIK